MATRYSFLASILICATSLCAGHFPSPYSGSPYPVDSLLHVLDVEMERSDVYIAKRQQQIDSVKAVFYAQNKPVETAIVIGELYVPYQVDSALVWLEWANKQMNGKLPENVQFHYEFSKNHRIGNKDFKRYDSTYVSTDSHEYAVYAYFYADRLLKQRSDTLHAIYLLTQSALLDVRQGVTDNGSCWRLAEVLYKMNDFNRAYDYIEYSCQNADIYNSQIRYTQIAPIAHGIAKTYRQKLWTAIKMLFWATLLCAVVIIGLIISIIYSIRKNKQLRRLNNILKETKKRLEESNLQLSEMNRTREQYICVYLEEQSAIIRRAYKDNLKAGKPDAEEKFIKQVEQYCKNFDTTFLRLFPNFIERFNSLLRLDSQITCPEEGQLTPELRIFALIRLGIDKSTRIADLLCLSSNTVYNYRSRLRNAALKDKDEFEAAVREL